MQNTSGKYYYFKIIHHMLLHAKQVRQVLHVYDKLKPRSSLTKNLLIKSNISKA